MAQTTPSAPPPTRAPPLKPAYLSLSREQIPPISIPEYTVFSESVHADRFHLLTLVNNLIEAALDF